jgi:hypothetical protein
MYPTDSKSLPAHEQSSRLVVVTLGLSHPIEEDRLAPFRAVHAKNAEDALRILTEGGVAALLLGPCADLLQVPDLLARSAAKPSGNPAPATIVLCAASEPDALQKLVDAGQIFYVARGEVSAEQLSYEIMRFTFTARSIERAERSRRARFPRRLRTIHHAFPFAD